MPPGESLARGHRRAIGRAMNGIGNPNRNAEPLRVLAMALALVAAACAGAGLGFLLDMIRGEEPPAEASSTADIGMDAP